MKLFRKVFVLSLVLVAALVLSACGGTKKSVLRVGTPKLSGDFVAGFGSSAYDVYVRDLIHGYGTLVETEGGEFVWNTEAVLADEPEATEDNDGNKTYTFKLQEDLKWNNGEKIVAKDYVLNILLLSSKDWLSIATAARAGDQLLGYDEYHKGAPTGQKAKMVQDEDENGEPLEDENGDPVMVEAKDEDGNTIMEDVFNPNYTVLDVKWGAVRLLGEFEFSLQIDAANLPYFYESTAVSSAPIDVETYLPGFDVKDDGQGAYITRVEGTKSIAETVTETINKVGEGQRYKPTVTAGPYQFVSFQNDTAIVELNPNFKTNYEGKKPTIDQIEITYVNAEVDVEQVLADKIDIVSGVIQLSKIEAAKNADNAGVVSYFRNGYGLMAFAQYWGPTQFAEVRRAMGYLIDREVFLTQFLGGYGSKVNGPYGEAQWFYKDSKEELDELLTDYALDVDKANVELDNSPYKFEQDGTTPWDPAKATATNKYFRHDKDGNSLTINHLSASADVGNLINLELSNNGWEAGLEFKYTATEDFNLLLDHYYYGSAKSAEELTYHSFNLASNFYSNYDPFYQWHSTLAGTTYNPGGLKDDKIDELTEKMQKLDPTQREEFREMFVEFVVRWNELLPNIPLYSNEYFDVYNTRIEGLQSTPVWSWAKDICDIKIVK